MATPQNTQVLTASVCVPETVHGTHSFKIDKYGLYRGLGVGNCIQSANFTVGGHEWCIRLYPDGYNEANKDYVSVFLELKTKNIEVRAMYNLMLVNQAIQPPVLPSNFANFSDRPPVVFDTRNDKLEAWGFVAFKKKCEIEGSSYILDDSITVACNLTIITLKDAKEVDAGLIGDNQVPPSELVANLSKLLGCTKGADVCFKVQNEVFHAHEIILAMRSPVFWAEFYGPMRFKHGNVKNIEDMQPGVFIGLLHFIYTDSLPPMKDLNAGGYEEMLRHLLVAADKYAMKRMKSICEGKLCQRFDQETVATTLALAVHYNCSMLKDACIKFINSLSNVDGVVASKGYQHLKRACPTIFVDMWEMATKARKV
ncbi:BTB/POZ and MATH domain-containing protein 2 [Triticum urartu]|uniref:BTB/POZ and MATH domain-containing protein 2 n=1 Tax=Triticum urartu TaxID=4572 RepID=M7Z6X5_TRIUA|nr:BTB/POZ and MATH domain-containing protein 2-like [Triticum urartu]EMS58943.1 BTB/POZ and MATH domain-containing protein 2 [Triticum urartu]